MPFQLFYDEHDLAVVSRLQINLLVDLRLLVLRRNRMNIFIYCQNRITIISLKIHLPTPGTYILFFMVCGESIFE